MLGWTAATIWWVEKNRESLDSHVSWITKATALHHQLAARTRERRDSSNRNNLDLHLDPATLGDLRTGLWETAPDTVALTKAGRQAWDGDIRLVSGLDPPGSEEQRLAAVNSVIREIERRIGRARQRTRTISIELSGSWVRLYVLSGLALIALGALAVPLTTISRQARSLRESQSTLENRERRYRELIELSQDLIWSVDAEGRWTFLNHAANSVYGRTPGEMIGRRLMEFVAPERTEQDRATFAKVLESEPIRQYETIHVHRDGSPIPMLFNGVALRDETGNVIGATGTAADISDIMAMKDRLREDERLRSVGQLAGGVAHDFNNLLTGILGHLESIDRHDVGEDIRRSLDTIRNAATGGSRLTHQLLAFAGRQTLRRRVIELATIGRDVHALLAGILGDDITLESNGNPGVFVKADNGQIEQTLVNLVLNARDALPTGGTVKVSWSQTELDAEAAEHSG